MSRNLNICDVFWTNQVQMRQSVVGRWLVGGGFQMLLRLCLMLGVGSLSVLGSLLVLVLTYGSEKMICK